jgi:predicted metalloprotease with PDZ domain
MKKLSALLVLCFITLLSFGQTKTKINFVVSFPDAANHYADVEMNIADVKDAFIDLKMPVWTPGSYLVREFSRNVEQFTANGNNDSKLKSEKINKNTWRVYTNGNKNLSVKYKVYAFEISVRTSFIDASHAFLSTTSIFMYPDKMKAEPSTVEIKLSQGWDKISTGMASVGNNTYYAQNFDWLFDSPIEVGNQDVFTFNAAGVAHEVAMYGGGNYNKERLKVDMAKIVEELTTICGENPNKNYTFIVHNYANYGGGLEHLNSTTLGMSRLNYGTEEGYLNFLTLVAHEYFHLWNVKRIRPIALGPFNYDVENYTPNLWVSEGFTSYYENIVVRRAGYTSKEKYFDALAADFNALDNTPGSRLESASESSFDSWIIQYRPNENSKNSSFSYYGKGSVIGACLDLLIINSTKGEKCLDDVMKSIYNTYYLKEKRGFTDAEFKATAEKIAGISLDDFYAKYINGTIAVPFQEFLSYAGLTIKDLNANKNEPSLGLSSSPKDGKIMVTQVARNGSAWNSGLNVNDEIIAIDNYRLDNLDKQIGAKKVGDVISVLISRDGVLKTISVKLQRNPSVKYSISSNPSSTEDQQKVLKKWLKL